MKEARLVDLGVREFAEVWKLQLELVGARQRDEIPDTLLLVEHPHVITAASRPQGLIAAKRARSVDTFSANPCIVTQRLTAMPIEASFRAPSVVQTPVHSGLRAAASSKRARARMIASSILRR